MDEYDAELDAEDARDCAERLNFLEAKLLLTLTEHPMPDMPRFVQFLRVSALLRLASRLMLEGLEAMPEDRARYVALVHEVDRRLAGRPSYSTRVQ
jgi:hypothetical protein